jgi:sterol desaturase/sphingolipid hydroxylase (fatty acid hydroxylase superfamily)
VRLMKIFLTNTYHGLHHRIEEVELLTSIIIHVIEELQNQSRFPAPR